MHDTDILIVGAGASGLMAAANATGGPFSVSVAERNATAGRKLAITGKGRCNVTNSANVEDSVRRTPGNGKFLYSAFSAMPNAAIAAYFEDLGVPLGLERGGRYFTRSGDAHDVAAALVRRAESRGARFLWNARVRRITRGTGGGSGRRFTAWLADGRSLGADAVVLATGGMSYPATGSTGDGYALARAFGHGVTPPRPSLVPLETVEEWPRALAGLSLKNVALKLFGADGKRLFAEQGEMLFTHFGVSGPIVLSGSRNLLGCGFEGCAGRIDMKPGLTPEKLEARIMRDLAANARKSLRNAVFGLLPSRMVPIALGIAGMDGAASASGVGRRGAARLASTLKGLPFTVAGARPIAEAIVTAGGVRTPEANPSTMESKLVPGLFFCGELLDVDAYTGGFNLSIAFATGALAAKGAIASLARLRS